MGRPRFYESAAERQKAYRERLAAALKSGMPTAPTPPPQPKRRPPTRPARLEQCISVLQDMTADYEGWLEATPETLQETPLAEKLAEAIQQLQDAIDLLNEIDLPKGFGRD